MPTHSQKILLFTVKYCNYEIWKEASVCRAYERKRERDRSSGYLCSLLPRALPLQLDEVPAQCLPGCRLGDGVDELHIAYFFVGGDARCHVGDQLLGRHRRASTLLHKGL